LGGVWVRCLKREGFELKRRIALTGFWDSGGWG